MDGLTMTPQERIEALALQRGGRVVAVVAPPRQRDEFTEPKREGVLYRRLPMSWTRTDEDGWRKPGKATRSRAEVRVAGWLICKALGDDWHKAIENDNVYLEHTSGFRMLLKTTWQDMDRYEISPRDCWQYRNEMPSSITVNAGRTPISIAGDIQRKILSHDPIEKRRLVQQNKRTDRDKETTEKLCVLAIAKMFGKHQLSRHNHVANGHPYTGDMKCQWGEISVMADYMGRIVFHIETNQETAGRLAERLQVKA